MDSLQVRLDVFPLRFGPRHRNFPHNLGVYSRAHRIPGSFPGNFTIFFLDRHVDDLEKPSKIYANQRPNSSHFSNLFKNRVNYNILDNFQAKKNENFSECNLDIAATVSDSFFHPGIFEKKEAKIFE